VLIVVPGSSAALCRRAECFTRRLLLNVGTSA